MYVDDVLAGGHSIGSAIKPKNVVILALITAGFPLRKWTSNHVQILEGIPKSDLLNKDFLDFENTSLVKALGIRWNAHSDTFNFIAKELVQIPASQKGQYFRLFSVRGYMLG